jgi:hypothetical protein
LSLSSGISLHVLTSYLWHFSTCLTSFLWHLSVCSDSVSSGICRC